MSQNRKLQAEIDKTFKRVQEGVEAFNDVWEKLYTAPNQSQKDKYEAELKKEIKKLQRYRDQIKSWISSTEVKDKNSLLENRKLIETKMEMFKACEKEMKTKAYSKEGLASNKMDPKEKAKLETRRWISDLLETIGTQMEALEAEIEALQLANKKPKKGEANDRFEALQNHLTRHRVHQTKLEIILRMLENDSLEPEQVNGLQDDITYYLENYNEPDYVENEELYDELDLTEEDLLDEEERLERDKEREKEREKEKENGKEKEKDGKELLPVVKDVKDTKDPKDVKDVKDVKEIKEVKEVKEIKEVKEVKEAKEVKEVKEKDVKESKEKEEKSSKDVKEKEPKEKEDPKPKTTPPLAQIAAPSKHKGVNERKITQDATGPSLSPQPGHLASPPPLQPQVPNLASPPLPSPQPQQSSPPIPQQSQQAKPLAYGAVAASAPKAPISYSSVASQQKSKENTQENLQKSPQAQTLPSQPLVSPMPLAQQPQFPTPQPTPPLQQNPAQYQMPTSQPSLNLPPQQPAPTQPQPTISQLPSSILPQAIVQPVPQHPQISQPILQPIPQQPTLQQISSQQISQQLPQQLPQQLQQQLPPQMNPQLAPQQLPLQVIPTMPQGIPIQSTTPLSQQLQQVSTPQPQLQASPPPPAHSIPPPIQGIAGQEEEERDLLFEAFEGKVPSSLSDLLQSYDSVLHKNPDPRLEDPISYQQMLEGSFQTIPDGTDSERPRQYFPKNPFSTPPYYPQAPHPAFENPAVFEKMDIDTLFFIFYFQQGTYQQYLAAKELKKQSWRFHKKYMTWFQRHEEPKSITEEYEQGTYVYFDYETNWCQRKKSEFTFEYRYLEDETFV